MIVSNSDTRSSDYKIVTLILESEILSCLKCIIVIKSLLLRFMFIHVVCEKGNKIVSDSRTCLQMQEEVGIIQLPDGMLRLLRST